jgi:hypothetical protein
LRQKHWVIDNNDVNKAEDREHKIDVADERSNFLEYEVYAGKLFFIRKINVQVIIISYPMEKLMQLMPDLKP